MKIHTFMGMGFLLGMVFACGQNTPSGTSSTLPLPVPNMEARVDSLHDALTNHLGKAQVIAQLDHHRMAQEEGVYTPPAIATIASVAQINSVILNQRSPLIGLDLPYKYLCYAEADTVHPYVAYTSSKFISMRHGVDREIFSDYDLAMKPTLSAIQVAELAPSPVTEIPKGFGIVQIPSDFDYSQTIERLKNIVHAQNDTRWFGEIDYTNQAKEWDITLLPITLLLFGGPAPGAKAMHTTPRIGLDAFCQKLLVYEDGTGQVYIAFNDIVAFSELYYGQHTKIQQGINQRLTATFTKAITNEK